MNEEYTERDKALLDVGINTKEIIGSSDFNNSQYLMAFLPTPKSVIKKRPARGGGTWDYVPAAWVIERLNQMFGLMWSFVITDKMREGDEVIVEGYIEVPLKDGRSIKKYSVGGKEIQYRGSGTNKTNVPLSLSNDYKAASSDCLKKCATQLGVALDLYLDEIDVARKEALREQRLMMNKIEAQKELTNKL